MSAIIAWNAGDVTLERVANRPARPSEPHSNERPASDTAKDMLVGSEGTPSSSKRPIRLGYVFSLYTRKPVSTGMLPTCSSGRGRGSGWAVRACVSPGASDGARGAGFAGGG
jgi:hypothetical protein